MTPHSVGQCPKCGAPCQQNDKFCAQCGTRLDDTLDEPKLTVPAQPLVQKIKTKGVRKHATVLFADIKGSTAMIEGLDPEEASETLGPAIEKMLSSVYQYDGTIIHTAGDGIVAIFGAPQTREDHALRASLAALLMQEKLKTLPNALQIRVGLNSGEVLLDVVGDEQHLEYDITGPIVNLAARMEQTAKPGTIQMTNETLKLVEQHVTTISLGEVEVKGFQHPVSVFELVSIKENANLIEIKNRPILLPFVGREKEMQTLETLLKESKSGKGKAVGILGEAGQGKSRLIYEFTHSETAKSCTLLIGGGLSHTTNIPLLPIYHLFRNLIGMIKGESIAKTKEKFQLFLTGIDLPYALNAALALIDAPIHDESWNKLAPNLKQKYMFDIGIRILFNFAAKRQLILIMEDLHWIDSETEAFLDLLISKLNQSNLFFFGTYRAEYKAIWANRPSYTQINLTPLTTENEEIILTTLLGHDQTIIPIKQKLLNTCAGNPFFLEEMIQTLINEKILVGEAKNYYLNPTVVTENIRLPETIFAVLQMQIDRLPPLLKEVLSVASVIGEVFSYSFIAKLMEVDQKDLRQSLGALSDEHYIFEIQLYPEPKFSFKHALIQEVIYNGLLKATRRSLHLKILALMERLKQDPMDSIELMANHAYLGEDWSKAFDYCSKAGEQAFVLNAMKISVQFYQRAIHAANQFEMNEEFIEQLMFTHIELGHAFLRLGRFEEQGAELIKAMELATKHNNIYLQSIITGYFCAQALGLGGSRQALEYAEKSYRLAQECQSKDALIWSQNLLVHAYVFLGKYDKLNAIANEQLKTEPNLSYTSRVLKMPMGYLTVLIQALGNANTGDFSDIESKKETLLASVDITQPSNAAYLVEGALSITYVFKGDFDKAIPYLARTLHFVTEMEMVNAIPVWSACLGYCYLQVGKREEGQQCIEQAIQMARAMQFSFFIVFGLGLMAESLLLLGEKEKAKEFNDESLKIVREREFKGLEAWLLRTSAEIDLYLPNPDYAAIQQTLEDALQKSIQLGMFTHVAHCHRILSKFYQQTGDIQMAEHEASEAAKLYNKLGMEFWASQCTSIAS